MKSKEKQYQEMFSAEAFEAQEELNKLFTELEKNADDRETIESIFRITHTLKGNAMALGYEGIGELSHTLEDIFSVVKDKPVNLEKGLFKLLFSANDRLGEMIESLESKKEVNYKGLIAKLELYAEKHFDHSVDASSDNPAEHEEQLPVQVEEELNEDSDQETKVANLHFSDQVQIPIKKLDSLLNLVGELIIEKDTIIARNQTRSNSNEFKRLHRITSDMQYSIMDIRLVHIDLLFNKFHRIARDAAEIEQKEVSLVLEGTEIEIDRNILKTISDSLVHLVRNAIGHGIEHPEERQQAGKSTTGTLTLRARNEKDNVLIEVQDDGHGINPEAIKSKAVEQGIITREYAATLSETEIIYLIFEAGFSNTKEVTEISGRGVGMDVVKRATESIGGQIFIDSKIGEGTTFTLKLPSSMAVKGALLFSQDNQEFAAPLSFTEAVVSLEASEIHKVGKGVMAHYLGRTIPLVFLSDLFQLTSLKNVYTKGSLHSTFDSIEDKTKSVKVIIASYNNRYLGIVVDKLLQQKEIVEKPLSKPLDKMELFSGATILGNGNVCLVLNIALILEHMYNEQRSMKMNYAEAI
ncbi:MAG: chemotaxis protein CheA [Cyclobacteriaceae bacterium]